MMAASSTAKTSSISSRSAITITSPSCSARPSFPHHRFKTFSKAFASTSSNDNCRVAPSLKLPHIILWRTGLAMLRRKLLASTVFLEDLPMFRCKCFNLGKEHRYQSVSVISFVNFGRIRYEIRQDIGLERPAVYATATKTKSLGRAIVGK